MAALNKYIKAAGKGVVLKVMSKMGISTLASYTGAQLFRLSASRASARRISLGLPAPTGGPPDDIA